MKILLRSTLLLILLFSSCAKVEEVREEAREEGTIIGTWVRESDGREVTLARDGSYLMHLGDGNNLEGKWRSPKPGQIEIGFPDFEASFIVEVNFEISGDTLTVTNAEKDSRTTFKRKI